jgi:hypothetical protein
MLRRTSKGVKEIVDKMRLSAVVRLRTTADRGREACRSPGAVPGAGAPQSQAESLAGVLGQCTTLARLNFCGNDIDRDPGAKSLVELLTQCTALAHLDLYSNKIGTAGAESFAGVLAQCTALAHLNLCANSIGTVWEGRLRASWRGQARFLAL